MKSSGFPILILVFSILKLHFSVYYKVYLFAHQGNVYNSDKFCWIEMLVSVTADLTCLFLWFICSVGIFEWGMLYKEGPLPKKEANKREHFTEPYNSPTHAGGLFAIKRDWFKDLGWYDPGEYMLMLDICCGKSQN